MSEQTEKDVLRSEAKYASDISFYALQRIDLLVISVGGAGIYACWEILKFIKTEHISANLFALKLSGLLFLSTIILNFIGQWASYKANNAEEMIKRLELDEIEKKHIGGHKDSISNSECDKKIYNRIVKKSNTISLFILFIGLILISLFVSSIF